MTNEEMEKCLAFCCSRCYCSKDRGKKISPDDTFVQSSQGSLYHGRCCHKAIKVTTDWQSRMEEASVGAEDDLLNEVTYEKEEKVIDCDEFKRMVDTAESCNPKICNDESLTGKLSIILALCQALLLCSLIFTFTLIPLDPTTILSTDTKYVENKKVFEKLPKQAAAVVLVSAQLSCE
jgi:hypothetical protein